jgi:uncharacterized membrane protein
MNPQYEKQLEASVRRELDTLGEMPAPPALAHRIMRVIGQRSAAPWYRCAWQTWPMPARAAALVGLLLVFASICLGVNHAITAGLVNLSDWLTSIGALWTALSVIANTTFTFVGRLGTPTIIVGFAMFFTACATCVGLGTAYVRLALRLSVNEIEK